MSFLCVYPSKKFFLIYYNSPDCSFPINLQLCSVYIRTLVLSPPLPCVFKNDFPHLKILSLFFLVGEKKKQVIFLNYFLYATYGVGTKCIQNRKLKTLFREIVFPWVQHFFALKLETEHNGTHCWLSSTIFVFLMHYFYHECKHLKHSAHTWSSRSEISHFYFLIMYWVWRAMRLTGDLRNLVMSERHFAS